MNGGQTPFATAMGVDLDGFLGGFAQAMAAFAGLAGAFLVSKLVQLEADLERQLDDANRAQARTEGLLARLENVDLAGAVEEIARECSETVQRKVRDARETDVHAPMAQLCLKIWPWQSTYASPSRVEQAVNDALAKIEAERRARQSPHVGEFPYYGPDLSALKSMIRTADGGHAIRALRARESEGDELRARAAEEARANVRVVEAAGHSSVSVKRLRASLFFLVAVFLVGVLLPLGLLPYGDGSGGTGFWQRVGQLGNDWSIKHTFLLTGLSALGVAAGWLWYHTRSLLGVPAKIPTVVSAHQTRDSFDPTFSDYEASRKRITELYSTYGNQDDEEV
jgi:hypothetical protein